MRAGVAHSGKQGVAPDEGRQLARVRRLPGDRGAGQGVGGVLGELFRAALDRRMHDTLNHQPTQPHPTTDGSSTDDVHRPLLRFEHCVPSFHHNANRSSRRTAGSLAHFPVMTGHTCPVPPHILGSQVTACHRSQHIPAADNAHQPTRCHDRHGPDLLVQHQRHHSSAPNSPRCGTPEIPVRPGSQPAALPAGVEPRPRPWDSRRNISSSSSESGPRISWNCC